MAPPTSGRGHMPPATETMSVGRVSGMTVARVAALVHERMVRGRAGNTPASLRQDPRTSVSARPLLLTSGNVARLCLKYLIDRGGRSGRGGTFGGSRFPAVVFVGVAGMVKGVVGLITAAILG